MTETLCAYCGVYNSYYQCFSCNKKFCIDDWDNAHKSNFHQKERIIFPVNEDSRQILIDYLEKLKSENLKFYKENIREACLDIFAIEGLQENLNANIVLQWLIYYIGRTKFVKKQLLYNPLDYFLIKPPTIAEKYVNTFKFSNSKDTLWKNMIDFVFINYLKFNPEINYGFEFSEYTRDENFDYLIIGSLMGYIVSYNYKSALELLNNVEEFPWYVKIYKSESGIEIELLKNYIVHLMCQDFNIDLDLWDQAAKIVNHEDNLWLTELFYRNSELIFCALNNEKYRKKCLIYLLKEFKRKGCYLKMNIIYQCLSFLYNTDNEKHERCLIKAYKIYKKNKKTIILDLIAVQRSIFSPLISLTNYYLWKDQAKQKKIFNECKYYFKLFKSASVEFSVHSLCFFGTICFLNMNYKDSEHYLSKCKKTMRKKNYINNFCLIYVNYYQGLMLLDSKLYSLAVQKFIKLKKFWVSEHLNTIVWLWI